MSEEIEAAEAFPAASSYESTGGGSMAGRWRGRFEGDRRGSGSAAGETEMIVQTLRVQRGWTQEELALVSGVGVRTIQRIERGQTASDETLKSLAAAFDIDFRSLKEPTMSIATESAASPDPRRAEELLAFDHVRRVERYWFGLVAFAIVVPSLVAVNLFYSPGTLWAIFPAAFWALALVIRGVRLFARWPFGPEWERREVEKRLGRSL
jgi:transcriptional regulator with XRE-family HTH domain